MYRNVAIIADLNPDLEDLSVPLRINNCGYYRIHDGPTVKTLHYDGRNDYQLIYIAAGKGEYHLKNGTRIVEKGNMILYRPGEPQVYTYYAADKCDIYWVHFTGSKVEGILSHYNLPKDENVFFTGSSPDYKWIYNQMIRELQLRRDNYEELLPLLLRHIMLLINRYLKEQKKGTKDIFSGIESAIHYFNENYNKSIKIEQYAKEHYISTNRFIENFKNVANMTPTQYILHLRISAAKDRLVSTDKSIKEIAAEVGYNNPLYFSRLFRKIVGLSPSDYRANVRYQNESLRFE